MTIFTPGRSYPYDGWDRVSGEDLNLGLEFNPAALPPIGNAGGARQFKYWIDTGPTNPVLRMCVVPQTTPGVYVPVDWLELYALDIAAGKFLFAGDNISFLGALTLTAAHLTGDLTVDGHTILETLDANTVTIDNLTAAAVTVTDLTATGTIACATLNAAAIAATGNITGAAVITGATVVGTTYVDGGQLLVDGHLFADGDAATRIGIYEPGGAQNIILYTTGNNYYQNENHVFRRRDQTTTMLNISPTNVGVDVNLSVAGTAAVTGAMSAASLTTTGHISAGGHVNSVLLQLNGLNFAANTGAQQIIYDTGGVPNITQYNTGDNLYDNTRHSFRGRAGVGSFAIFELTGTYNASGSWIVFSDALLKEGLAPYERGLEAILALQPVAFSYKPGVFSELGDPAAVRIGLVAQDVASVIPEIVGSTELELDGKMTSVGTLSPGMLVYVLINACKELDTRLSALEGP